MPKRIAINNNFRFTRTRVCNFFYKIKYLLSIKEIRKTKTKSTYSSISGINFFPSLTMLFLWYRCLPTIECSNIEWHSNHIEKDE